MAHDYMLESISLLYSWRSNTLVSLARWSSRKRSLSKTGLVDLKLVANQLQLTVHTVRIEHETDGIFVHKFSKFDDYAVRFVRMTGRPLTLRVYYPDCSSQNHGTNPRCLPAGLTVKSRF